MHNILHVVNIYFVLPYFIGDQFLYFKNKGNNLYVICSPSPYLKEYSSKMGFNYKEVEIKRAFSLFGDIKAIISICCYIQKMKIDIIVGHTPKGALLSMISGFIMRVPTRIYFRHGLVYETAKGLKKKLLIGIDRLTAFCSTKVVCVSPSLYKRSLEHNLNKEKKQTILGKGTCGGIDTLNKFNPVRIDKNITDSLRKKLGIPENSLVIGYCGRLVRDKGIIDLVNAFETIRYRFAEGCTKLLLIGMFEERDTLPVEIQNKIIGDKDIIVTGFINDFIENYYTLIDIFILPSYREGFGMSVLEASAMQIPVLTTRVTGCIDSIIENFTGKYVDNDSLSIANEVEYYIRNPKIAEKHGLNGREFVLKNFDQELIWIEIEKLYEN